MWQIERKVKKEQDFCQHLAVFAAMNTIIDQANPPVSNKSILL